MKHLEFHQDIPIIAETQILVIGAGPAGICAAIAAADEGVQVMLIDQNGFCGGMASAGLVGPILGVYHWESKARILGGIPYRLLRSMELEGGAELENPGMLVPFDPEVLKHVCERILVSAGVIVRYHTKAVSVTMDEANRISAVIVGTGSGLGAIQAAMYIDCTGDGLVAAQAGASFTLGRESDHAMMPMTTVYRLGGVDTADIARTENVLTGYVNIGVRHKLAAALDETLIPPFGGPWIMRGSTMRPGEAFVNMVRQWGDPTDWQDISRVEIAGRNDMFILHDYLRRHVDWLADSFIMDSGASIGIRDSRHFHCVARLTLAIGGHILDIHATDGSHNQTRTTLPAYEIPLSSCIFSEIPNLLIAGRMLDADYGMFASSRVMGTCMAIGEGVGLAAAMCVKQRIAATQLVFSDLSSGLKTKGAIVDLASVRAAEREGGIR